MTTSCLRALVMATFSLLLSLDTETQDMINIFFTKQKKPEKADISLVIWAHQGHDDHLLLPPLETVHRLDLQLGVTVLEVCGQQLYLRAVGSDHADLIWANSKVWENIWVEYFENLNFTNQSVLLSGPSPAQPQSCWRKTSCWWFHVWS